MSLICTDNMSEELDNLYERALQVAIELVPWTLLNRRGIELLVRRDDQLDGRLSGNKFYKLFFNMQAARAAGISTLASFGGAYSNHLHALAAAGQRYGFNTVGLVRGEQPAELSPTLQDAQGWGMTLHHLPRDVYRTGTTEPLLSDLRARYGDVLLIPEGGANAEGARGAQVIGQAIEQQLHGDYHQVCMPCGTGTTLAGVAAGLPTGKIALGFSVLKGAGTLRGDIASAHAQLTGADSTPNWRLISGFHGGGYAKKLPEALRHFWCEFELETGLKLDPVYTLKMFSGIAGLACQNYWPEGTRLVAIHTGGLQGRRGFAQEIDW